MKPSTTSAWALALSLVAPVALAEGSTELGSRQRLRADTQMYVDVVSPNTEELAWTGTGTLRVTAPNGTTLVELASGESFAFGGHDSGAYGLVNTESQQFATPWSIEVKGAKPERGRVFSYAWQFDAGSFEESAATNASFYARVPSGPDATAVIELKLNGLAGFVFDVLANGTGVDGAKAGKSVPAAGNAVSPAYPIYLLPPELASYASVTPAIDGFSFFGGGTESGPAGSTADCQQFVSGGTPALFTFETQSESSYHVLCDLDGDGRVDRNGSGDLLLVGNATPGENRISWDGRRNDGSLVPDGIYTCELELHTGEFHYVGRDIETSYPGMQLYAVAADLTRDALPMYWDDALVQGNAQAMPNGELGRESSGETGVTPGPYGAAVEPNVNARSWGAFNSGGKGNQAFLDTYTWLEASERVEVRIESVSSDVDTDGDGLSDQEERCETGSDPNNSDTDGDGVDDGTQYGPGEVTSGNEGGLESNANRRDALARRAVDRLRASPIFPYRASIDDIPNAAPTTLAALMPSFGPLGSLPVDATPADLVDVTVAHDVSGVDYHTEDGRRVASILLLESQGRLYDHSKAICDRSRGAVLESIDVVSTPFGDVVRSRFTREGGERETSISAVFKQVPGQDGFVMSSEWARSNLVPPVENARVIEAQLWTSVDGAIAPLFTALAAQLPGGVRVSTEPGALPEQWIRSARSFGDEISIELSSASSASIAVEAYVENKPVDVQSVSQDGARVVVRLARPASDASVRLGDGADEVWLSDGAWVGVGQQVDVAPCTDDMRHAEGTTLAGCASLQTASEGDGVVRLFHRDEDLRAFDVVSFYRESSSALRVCTESAQARRFACAAALVPPGTGRVEVRLPRQDLDSVKVMSFMAAATGGTLIVGALSLRTADVDEPVLDSPSCSSGNPAPWSASLLAALAGLAFWRRRSRRR